ncbi:FG-GAP repeat domain-containing protein [Streptomyces sp. NPDC101118]|uniref:FG-GAP repeat domain-containing protein n=1 Tax=Streptomyces sp. NPDC101118 TaxID=3366109 RepID=UPI003815C35D
MRKWVALGAALVMLGGATAGPALAAPAAPNVPAAPTAEEPPEMAWRTNILVANGSGAYLSLARPGEWFSGVMVYVFNKKGLPDADWSDGGLPKGMTVHPGNGCYAKRGVVGVWVCDASTWGDSAQGVSVGTAKSVPSGTKVWFGAAAVGRDGIDAAVKRAQRLTEDRRITVKTRADAAKNTFVFTAPRLKAGGTVTHTVKAHVVDRGDFELTFGPAPGQRGWNPDAAESEVYLRSLSAPGVKCSHGTDKLAYIWSGGGCTLPPGDHTITYTLAAGKQVPAWKLRATAVHKIFTSGDGDPGATADFRVSSPLPVAEDHVLLGRAGQGELWANSMRTLNHERRVGSFWHIYDQGEKLAPITTQGTGGGVVGRDADGVLWHYRTTTDGRLLKQRTRVGSGWGKYDKLAGGGDLTGDGRADLLARDRSGVLWLYAGTGRDSAPFAPRTKAGGSWKGYNEIAGGADLNGDRKPDLLARDASGVLWLVPGTGRASSPFGQRVKIGSGWRGYRTLSVLGDIDRDYKADVVAQDATGAIWIYRGTGKASAPFAPRERASAEADARNYNLLF